MTTNPTTKPTNQTLFYYLKKVQHWSGVCFAVFTSLHVGTTISAAISPSTYDHVLQLTRGIYRPNMIAESALIFSPLCLHMISNGLLTVTANKPTTTTTMDSVSLTKKLHKWSGYVLGATVPMHMIGMRFKNSHVAEFASLNFMAEKKMGQLGAWVYFAVLLAAGVYHGMFGVNVALGYKLKRPTVVAGVVAVLAASYFGLLGVVGFLYPAEMDVVRAKHVHFQH